MVNPDDVRSYRWSLVRATALGIAISMAVVVIGYRHAIGQRDAVGVVTDTFGQLAVAFDVLRVSLLGLVAIWICQCWAQAQHLGRVKGAVVALVARPTVGAIALAFYLSAAVAGPVAVDLWVVAALTLPGIAMGLVFGWDTGPLHKEPTPVAPAGPRPFPQINWSTGPSRSSTKS